MTIVYLMFLPGILRIDSYPTAKKVVLLKYAAMLLAMLTLAGCANEDQADSSPRSDSAALENKQQLKQRNGHADIKQTTNPEPVHQNKALPPKPSIPPKKIILNVPIIAQNPELKYGCEIVSLTMMLQYMGLKVNKISLAAELPKDNDPLRKNDKGDITHWGDPKDGFVGDVTGKKPGYAIYAEPLEAMMKLHLPGRTLNLTGSSFDRLLEQLRKRKPVVVWTTGDYRLPDRWESWKHGNETIRTPLDLHAVVLVGYDTDHIYVNDPLTGKKAHPVDKRTFIQSWIALGKQALSYN